MTFSMTENELTPELRGLFLRWELDSKSPPAERDPSIESEIREYEAELGMAIEDDVPSALLDLMGPRPHIADELHLRVWRGTLGAVATYRIRWGIAENEARLGDVVPPRARKHRARVESLIESAFRQLSLTFDSALRALSLGELHKRRVESVNTIVEKLPKEVLRNFFPEQLSPTPLQRLLTNRLNLAVLERDLIVSVSRREEAEKRGTNNQPGRIRGRRGNTDAKATLSSLLAEENERHRQVGSLREEIDRLEEQLSAPPKSAPELTWQPAPYLPTEDIAEVFERLIRVFDTAQKEKPVGTEAQEAQFVYARTLDEQIEETAKMLDEYETLEAQCFADIDLIDKIDIEMTRKQRHLAIEASLNVSQYLILVLGYRPDNWMESDWFYNAGYVEGYRSVWQIDDTDHPLGYQPDDAHQKAHLEYVLSKLRNSPNYAVPLAPGPVIPDDLPF